MCQYDFYLRIGTALLLMLLSGSIILPAQGTNPGDGGTSQGMNRGRDWRNPQIFMDRWDANHDGKVTTEESPGPPARFELTDTNKDKAITLKELEAARDQPVGGGFGPGSMFGAVHGNFIPFGGGFSPGAETGLAPAPPPISAEFGPGGSLQNILLSRLKDKLDSTDDEWSKLQPLVQKIVELREKTRMEFGFRPPEAPNSGNRGGSSFELPETTSLRRTLDDPGTSPDQLKEAIKNFREANKKAEDELRLTRDELRKNITPKQEGVLLIAGLLD